MFSREASLFVGNCRTCETIGTAWVKMSLANKLELTSVLLYLLSILKCNTFFSSQWNTDKLDTASFTHFYLHMGLPNIPFLCLDPIYTTRETLWVGLYFNTEKTHYIFVEGFDNRPLSLTYCIVCRKNMIDRQRNGKLEIKIIIYYGKLTCHDKKGLW